MAELVAPRTYEQYLSLSAPTGVAATNGYLAIADGNVLYVYDRAENVYLQYEHSAPIQKVTFDSAGKLYFLSNLRLYACTPENIKAGEPATDIEIVCESFAIEGDILAYYANNNALKFYSLSSKSELNEIALPKPLQNKSPLAFGKDGLFCVTQRANGQNGYTVYAINLQTYGLTPITNVQEKLRSMTVASNLLCLIYDSGNFVSYNVTDLSASENAEDVLPITTDDDAYTSLCSYSGNVYAICGQSIRHYSVETAAFTDYEICSSSASPNRLAGATEVTLNKNRLFIAEDENDRISVYDTQTQTFGEAIPTEFSNPYLASYQNTLLVASESETVVYSLAKRTYGDPLLTMTEEDIQGKIVGVASVYGRYYVLTEENYCYTLSKESGDWTWTQMQKNTQTLRAVSFTADVYGSLYIAYDDDTVYRFTEKELLNANARGKKILENLQFPEKIAVDYENDLYALVNGSIVEYSQGEGGMYALKNTYTPDYQLVKDDSPALRSFAFGLDTEFAYLLYEGDYIVRADELKIPAVNPIPVGNAAELIFGDTSADFSVVTVEIDSILIEFDVENLATATQFPYVAFERTQSVQTALKIGEEGEYSLLAIAKQRTGEYKTCLVLTESCSPLDRADYRADYELPADGYLTSAVSLYKFPYLNEFLTVSALERGSKVLLLGEVVKLDHAYYQIQITDENGNVKTGYVPKNYVTLFDGSTPKPEESVNGSTVTDEESVWRLAYLLLGFGAIIILVDFLILHEYKEEE